MYLNVPSFGVVHVAMNNIWTLRKTGFKTVIYDNWLIDPYNFNRSLILEIQSIPITWNNK